MPLVIAIFSICIIEYFVKPRLDFTDRYILLWYNAHNQRTFLILFQLFRQTQYIMLRTNYTNRFRLLCKCFPSQCQTNNKINSKKEEYHIKDYQKYELLIEEAMSIEAKSSVVPNYSSLVSDHILINLGSMHLKNNYKFYEVRN